LRPYRRSTYCPRLHTIRHIVNELTDFKFIMACKASIGFRKSAKNRPLEAALDTRAPAGQPRGRPQSVRDAGYESFRRLHRAICETQLRVWREKATSPPTGQVEPSGMPWAASDVSRLKYPHHRCCAAPRHRRDGTTAMRSARTPIDLYGIASAHAICPSKPSVLAMSR
jgi:hypothetical protein